jgi:competence protein ComEC
MLRVHFLNVGHGDCTIISHPSGRLTMIDINNSQDYDDESFQELLKEERQKADAYGFARTNALQASGLLGASYNPLRGGMLAASPNPLRGGMLAASPNPLSIPRSGSYDAIYAEAVQDSKKELTDPIEFLKHEYPGQSLFRFILTHPDLDHMRGLKRLHENIGFTNFWDTAHSKPTPKYRSDADREDWKFYQTLRSGAKNYTRGNSCFAFGKDENGVPGGDNIEILSPTPALVKSCNQSEKSNDLSLVLRVRHKNWSVLLPGDAEAEAWDGMKNHYGAGLKSDYLKASHHGRDSGFHLESLKLIAPRVSFVSVGRKPDTDASSKYRQQCNKVASTRYRGDMELLFDDDGTHKWFVQRNADN